MNDLVIAGRYASALFELVKPQGEDALIEAELISFSEALKNSKELYEFFRNPAVELLEKEKALRGLYRKNFTPAHETLVRFFKVLLKKNRFQLVHDVAVSFKKIADDSQKEAMLLIQSAVPLSAQLEQQIASRMERITGAKVEIRKEVVPSLVGGVVVRFRNKILDGSVKNKIQDFQKQLLKINSFN